MNRLDINERAAIIRCLVEGNSIRSTARMTGAARNTITTLLVNLGRAASEFQDRTLRDLPSTRIECDERPRTSPRRFGPSATRMTAGLYLKSLSTPDLTYILASPPPGAIGFFIGDQTGGSGWDVELPDGQTAPYLRLSSGAVQVRRVFEAPDPPRMHLGQPIADRSAPGLARLYIAYLSRLVSEAETHSSNLSSRRENGR